MSKVYLAMMCVEYEYDQVLSVHETREGAENSIRIDAKNHHGEVEERNDYFSGLMLYNNRGCSWYIEEHDLEK